MNKGCLNFFMFECMLCAAAFADVDCPMGYSAITHSMCDTVMSPMAGNCDAGYQLREIPGDIMPADGCSVGTGIPLCDGYWTGTTCNQHSSLNCESGLYGVFYDNVVMAPMVGMCDVGYALRALPDGIVPYKGFVVDSGIQLEHSSYVQGDCPNGYVDLAVNDDTFFKVGMTGICTDGVGYITEQCHITMADSPVICGMLCNEGLEYTDVGTCASLCANEHKTLRTSTGLIIPMYATKQTTPSINLRLGEDICYVNLLPGTGANAINMIYNNQTYHTVK